MEIIYEGVDITGHVTPCACVHRDVSHGKADTLEITFRRAASWHRWEPQIDDTIEVTHKKYDTGILFVNTIVPEGDRFRIVATSLDSKAQRRAWDCYRNFTLQNLIHRCAVECGMTDSLYGAAGEIRIPYIERENEGCASFLEKLCTAEGIVLKSYNRGFIGIGIEWAQGQSAIRSYEISPEQDGCRYIHQPGRKYKALTVKTPWAEATAKDDGAEEGYTEIRADLPAMDAAQAGRWARGLLLCHNRETDRLNMGVKFDPALTAMMRVDITGNTGMAGAWIIDEAEHDLYNENSTIKMLRVVETIR